MDDLFASGPEWLLEQNMVLYREFLAAHRADALTEELLTRTPWVSETLTVYGKEHQIPRLQAWMGEPGIRYQYSGKVFTASPWTSSLSQLAADISSVAGTTFNSVLLNLYRDGQDAMGWHADDEPELGPAPIIASLTLGAERDFALRRKGSNKQDCVVSLPHNSLLIMQAGMQSAWQHSLPRRARINQPRINLTFRYIHYS